MFGRNNVPVDTSNEALERQMANAEVEGIIVEVLGTVPGNPADPSKREMGKKKNHWVLRLLIRPIIEYYRSGVKKACFSVRASVEHPEGSLLCRKVTLRPMANSDQMSNSALSHFGFQILRRGLKVKDFMAEAECLLPFEYQIVAKSLVPAATQSSGSRRGASGRREELQEHPNGCRDFTAQWFYRLHRAGYVSWETVDARHARKLQAVQNSEAFHHLIGYRYSPGRIDVCPIAQANMPAGQRYLQCRVALVFNPDAGTLVPNAPDIFTHRILLPYQEIQPPVQVFKQTPVLHSKSARARS